MDAVRRWKSKVWVRNAAFVLAAALLAFGFIRWWWAYRDLNRPERVAAWEEIQRTRVYDLARTATDPRAVKLWLAAGRDANGHDCAKWGQPPSAFALGILRPLRLCSPIDSTEMPFIRATLGSERPEVTEAIRLMIAAGVDVNEAAPDGPLPLINAVLLGNEAVVRMLLGAGADPLLRPPCDYGSIGAYQNALEIASQMAESKKAAPSAVRIRNLLRDAVKTRTSGK